MSMLEWIVDSVNAGFTVEIGRDIGGGIYVKISLDQYNTERVLEGNKTEEDVIGILDDMVDTLWSIYEDAD